MTIGNKHRVYLGLGSNLGDRKHNISQAIRLICERVGTVLRCSTMIETEPWGFESSNRFVNAVVLCLTELSPRQTLVATQQIERDLGRTEKSPPKALEDKCPAYKDRPIDIDILLYDNLTVDEPDLKIPHPLMNERDFVMTPLKQIYIN